MKQYLLNRKWLGYGIFAALLMLPLNNYAQSIKRQSISSYGSSVVTENVLIGQTAGQSYHTAVSVGGTTVSPGFQQPQLFSVKEIGDPVFRTLDVMVYPNPASHSITISSEKEIEQSIIRVTDINGKYLLSEKVPVLFSYTMDCASWANGVYLITIQDSQKNTKTLRLIISK
jgi:hypothetical protein